MCDATKFNPSKVIIHFLRPTLNLPPPKRGNPGRGLPGRRWLQQSHLSFSARACSEEKSEETLKVTPDIRTGRYAGQIRGNPKDGPTWGFFLGASLR